MLAFKSNSSSLEQILVPLSTCMSMAIMPLLDLHKKAPGLLSSSKNLSVLSFYSKSLCQTQAASGPPYRALFNLSTFPSLLYPSGMLQIVVQCTALLNLEPRGVRTLASAHGLCLTSLYLCMSISSAFWEFGSNLELEHSPERGENRG